MKVHVLPGDSLVETFRKTAIEGETIVCRECLMEGDLAAENLNDFWRVREKYLSENYPSADNFYRKNVESELKKLQSVSDGDEINLWFEYELFCQVNLWFCLWLIWDKDVDICRVAPTVRNENNLWKGFGGLDAEDLEICFKQKQKFSKTDINLGKNLWKAFCFKDVQELNYLGNEKSECFPHLKDVCQAAVELQSRPEKKLRELISEGETDFHRIFQKFSQTEGVYGFGDAQVKKIYDRIV